MNILITGSTGLLGTSLIKEARLRQINAIGAARNGADISIDITNGKKLQELIESIKPDLVINAAALINVSACEQDPLLALATNANPAANMAELSTKLNFDFVQISTDHFFNGDGALKHNESHAVTIMNEYARSKYQAEEFALKSSRSLVVRTNIVGFSPRPSHPAFADWVVKALEDKLPITLFSDFYTSSLDVPTFANSLFDLILTGHKGLINLAASEVFSKEDFIRCLARALELDSSQAKVGSVAELVDAKRANSLGLDVSKAELLLGYKLPGLNQVIEKLASQYLSKELEPKGQVNYGEVR